VTLENCEVSDGHRQARAVCSHVRASYLEALPAIWLFEACPTFVGDFHALGQQWGAPEGSDESTRNTDIMEFGNSALPGILQIWRRNYPWGSGSMRQSWRRRKTSPMTGPLQQRR
jgi:hypothetical protein